MVGIKWQEKNIVDLVMTVVIWLHLAIGEADTWKVYRTNSEANNSATFLMTNMVPQSPDKNRDYWRELEEYGRDLVEQDNELYVV